MFRRIVVTLLGVFLLPSAFAQIDNSLGYRATYQVIFEADWSAETHPAAFPSNPHFSGLVGATHTKGMWLWREGELATLGIESMAETGSKARLLNEINALVLQGVADTAISGPGISVSPGVTMLNFEVTQSFPVVSLTSMIAPSPDWFVGVDSLNLRLDGQWVEEMVIDLLPYDAGTDSGASYASGNLATNPTEPIERIDYSPLDSGVPIGRFRFELVETEGLFPISGHQSGWYYVPSRSGEGINFNVAKLEDRLFISVAWFTYLAGEQFWLFGNVDIEEGQDMATVEMFSTSGAGFGNDFNAEDVLRELWGSITVSHPACGLMMIDWEGGPEFGTGQLLMEQLVNVAGLECE